MWYENGSRYMQGNMQNENIVLSRWQDNDKFQVIYYY